MAYAARRLAKDGTVRGVICYHEPAIEVAAQTAQDLGLPSLPAQAARRCRDKHSARRAFADHGVPSAKSVLVHSAAEAASHAGAAGIRFCYPDQAGVITALRTLGKQQLPAYIDRLELTIRPGTRIAFTEGRMYNARIGYVIVTGATTAECADRLTQARAGIDCDVDPGA